MNFKEGNIMKHITAILAAIIVSTIFISGCSQFGLTFDNASTSDESGSVQSDNGVSSAETDVSGTAEESDNDNDDDVPTESVTPGKTITEDGTYTVSGNIDGQILVIAKTVTLVLDSATVNCSDGSGILGYYEGGKQNLTVELKGESTVTSTVGHGIQGKDNLIITGSGSVGVTAVKDGLHAGNDLTIGGGIINVLESFEGVEASSITINGGDTTVHATDDGINAATDSASVTPSIEISNGTLTIYANSDGIDSNGTLEITGGNVLVFLNGREGDVLDVVASATILPAVSGAVSINAGATVSVGDVWDGKAISGANAFFICVPDLVSGQSYTIVSNGNELTTATATTTVQEMSGNMGNNRGGDMGGKRGGDMGSDRRGDVKPA
jgi:hypothetical protein